MIGRRTVFISYRAAPWLVGRMVLPPTAPAALQMTLFRTQNNEPGLAPKSSGTGRVLRRSGAAFGRRYHAPRRLAAYDLHDRAIAGANLAVPRLDAVP